MALTLILMRHAKSSWDDPEEDDFNRPLNGRGRKSAPAIGEWLARRGYLPDVVLVSGARRTVETWERMARVLPETAAMQSAPALYLAEPKVILGVLRAQTAPTIMMIGHNPGFGLLALALAKTSPKHSKFAQYPTGATTVFEFEAKTWQEVEPRNGDVVDFAVPRELLG
ncbi:MAG: histidine phosphatase family protein [Pseudomonadota bacterium]